MAFLKPKVGTKVETTMRLYGFTNRKAFADHYRNVYQELQVRRCNAGLGS